MSTATISNCYQPPQLDECIDLLAKVAFFQAMIWTLFTGKWKSTNTTAKRLLGQEIISSSVPTRAIIKRATSFYKNNTTDQLTQFDIFKHAERRGPRTNDKAPRASRYRIGIAGDNPLPCRCLVHRPNWPRSSKLTVNNVLHIGNTFDIETSIVRARSQHSSSCQH